MCIQLCSYNRLVLSCRRRGRFLFSALVTEEPDRMSAAKQLVSSRRGTHGYRHRVHRNSSDPAAAPRWATAWSFTQLVSSSRVAPTLWQSQRPWVGADILGSESGCTNGAREGAVGTAPYYFVKVELSYPSCYPFVGPLRGKRPQIAKYICPPDNVWFPLLLSVDVSVHLGYSNVVCTDLAGT